MKRALAIDGMLGRLKGLVTRMALRRRWRPEAYCVLEAVWGARGEVVRLTGLSDKTARDLAQTLLGAGLLATEAGNRFAPYRAAYSIAQAPVLFPGLYPASKEVDILNVEWERGYEFKQRGQVLGNSTFALLHRQRVRSALLKNSLSYSTTSLRQALPPPWVRRTVSSPGASGNKGAAAKAFQYTLENSRWWTCAKRIQPQPHS